ncbi:DUF3971 domain-containing protein [Nitratireductor sp. StC3]|uniref:YhdP family protein n=1 Tax=Nitratireductor sp. StC3 TaxID=2126741 RepID=UPI000D0D827C|nr:DUF3971 domain-containing protein [Nitratireductor sp. StC3]PSM17914.1 hypothetical protein C7T96_13225 [Nitratireductor sp. StC3]
MSKGTEKHHWVRFRREDIRALDSLPSAASHEAAPRRARHVVPRWVVAGLAAICLLVAAALGGFYLAGTMGLGSERLRNEAQAALSSALGVPVALTSGPARFSLSGGRFIALEVPEVRVSAAAQQASFADIGALRLGLDLGALVNGRLAIDRIELDRARIAPGAMPGGGEGDLVGQVRNAHGLIDPDRVLALVFSAVEQALDVLGARSTRLISLRDVEIALDDGHAVVVRSAELTGEKPETVEIEGELVVAGRPLAVSAAASRTAGDRPGLDFRLRAEIAPLPRAEHTTQEPPLVAGSGVVTFKGTRSALGGPDRLEIGLQSDDLVVSVPDSAPVAGTVDLAAALVAGTGKVEFGRIDVRTGRSRFLFNGAAGPVPDPKPGSEPAYRYEFVSDQSRAAVADVSEPSLTFLARLAGRYRPKIGLLTASEIGVRTGRGELFARASMRLFADKAPSIVFAMDVPSMPVAHAKQLWPTETAPGARAWVIANVFGGMIVDSHVRLKVEADRLGNGVALSGEEVNGRFRIEDTRFDITGELPPVRDAFGTVEFRGNAVDIVLDSGTVFMPTGRTVAASNGTFAIEDAGVHPLIGTMQIDVAGNAPSIVEFASYKPIDAMRHLRFEPTDFSGDVSGQVWAEIPLQEDVPIESLDWKVSLDYQDLALAEPLDGQVVTDAQGSIVVDPQKAVIDAQARLNGLAATISMTEPLDSTAPGRARDITLVLDDAGRDKIAPELNEMLSGPVSLDVSVEEGGAQRIVADLTKARLRFPWVGWSKGAGVPAEASFVLEADGASTRLSDFHLTGKSFAVDGEVVLENGSLARAEFGKVALNRGDQVALTIARRAGRYDIAINGKAFDARSVIKLYLSDTEQAEESVESIPVSLKASVERVTGFGEEVLSAVSISLAGTGTDVGMLRMEARSSKGGKIAIVNGTDAGGRTVTMESGDAGAVLRFLNIYEYMQGGTIDLALAAQGKGPLKGQVDAREFWIVNEPKLRSLVATAPPEGDGRSLNEAVRRDIDVSKARFDRGYATVEKGDGYLSIARGILRGPVIGATFRGALYDSKGNIGIAGTFMPAYGFNRLFAEIPLLGQILGNGRDRGLIGITFKLSGNAKSPQLQVNPISVIAPGIFRSIFEFR